MLISVKVEEEGKVLVPWTIYCVDSESFQVLFHHVTSDVHAEFGRDEILLL